MIEENQVNLNRLKSLDNVNGVNVFRFIYEQELERALQELGIELDRFRLEDRDKFSVTIYPSREFYLWLMIALGNLELKNYVSVEDYSRLEEEYKKSGEEDKELQDWVVDSGKLKEVKLCLYPGDYIYNLFRRFNQKNVYTTSRDWY